MARRRRRRRRNAWPGNKRGHRLAALKGWRRRGRRRARRRGRRRGRRCNPGYAYYNRRHRRGGRRRFNRRRRNVMGPHRYRNPALSLRKPVSALTAGFNMGTLTTAGLLVGGAVGTGIAGGFLNQQVLGRIAPSMAGSTVARAVTNLASAGLVGAVGSMASSRVGADLLTGGVVKVVVDLINEFMPGGIGGSRPFSGMKDFLIEQQVAQARPLQGLNDFLIEQQVAQARPLQGYSMHGALDDI